MGNGPKSWNAAKRRLKRPQSAEAKASMAQDVGKTFTKRRKAAEEPVPMRPKPQLMKKKLADGEKRLRTLNKLLRQIEDLQSRQEKGEELDEQQQQKLDRLDDVMEEMEELMSQQ